MKTLTPVLTIVSLYYCVTSAIAIMACAVGLLTHATTLIVLIVTAMQGLGYIVTLPLLREVFRVPAPDTQNN